MVTLPTRSPILPLSAALLLVTGACGGHTLSDEPGTGDSGQTEDSALADGARAPEHDSGERRDGAPPLGRDGGLQALDGAFIPDARASDGGVHQTDANDPGHDGQTPEDSAIAHDGGRPDAAIVDAAEPDSTRTSDGGCVEGFHMCSSACVDDTAPATCGTGCIPCEAPQDGVASCDGVSCSYTCDPGFAVCATGCCSCGDVHSDPNNCGYCGHSCGSESCVDGVCGSTVVAADQANPYALAADDHYVYWTTTGSASTVDQAPVGGGGATVLVSSANEYPASISLLGGQVYWTDEIMGGSVSRVPIGGGASVAVAANVSYPGALAASGSTLYFTLQPFSSATGGAVLSVPIGGGTPTTVASNQEIGQEPSIAVGASRVYWTTYTDVVSAPLGGGAVATVAAQQYPYAVAADARNVYWTSGLDGGVVMERPSSGGASVTLATGQFYPNAITVDAANVYWTSGQGGTGTVVSVPIGGGTPVTVAANQAYPAAIAVNSTTLFWINFGDGTIHSVPK